MNRKVRKRIEVLRTLLVVNRVEILNILCKKDTCVCKMVEKLNLKNNLVSHHLKVLSDMGYLKQMKQGQHIVYGVTESKRDEINRVLLLINSKEK